MAEDRKDLPKPPLPASIGSGVPRLVPPVHKAMPGGVPLPPLPGSQAGPGAPALVKPVPIQKQFGAPAQPGMPPKIMPMPASSAVKVADDIKDIELTRRLNDMERRSDEIQESKTFLEKQIKDLEGKLQEEKEKVLLASLRSKEEAELATKVEVALKEMQDRLQKDKQTQELDDLRKKAEERARELEKKLVEERETWMQALREQMGQKETHDKDIEDYLSQRVSELEERWQEEKENIVSQLKSKEEYITKRENEFLLQEERLKKDYEKTIYEISGKLNAQESSYKTALRRLSEEKQMLAAQLEEDEKALINIRAQLSLMQSQAKLEKDKFLSEWQLKLEAEERKQAELLEKNACLQDEVDSLRKKIDLLIDENDSAIAQAQEKIESVILEFESRSREASAKNEVERELWRKSLLEIESRIVKEKENWTRELDSHKRAWERERESLINERGSLANELTRTRELLNREKEEVQKQVNQVKTGYLIDKSEADQQKLLAEDELRRQLAKRESEFKILEENYWKEREVLGKTIADQDALARSLEKKLSDTEINFAVTREKLESGLQNLEAKYWAEKERALELLKAKEEEIAELKKLLAQSELILRDKIQKEYNILSQKIEAERLAWQESFTAEMEAEQSSKIQLVMREIAAIKNEVEQDISSIEKFFQTEHNKWQLVLKDKEKEAALAAQEVDAVNREKIKVEEANRNLAFENKTLSARIENLQQAFNLKEKEAERFNKDVFQKETARIKSDMERVLVEERARWEAALKEKNEMLQSLRARLLEEEQNKKILSEELQKKFQEEMSILESRFQKQLEAGSINVVRKMWRYLNKTVIIVNFKPFFWDKKRHKYNG